MGEGYDSVVTTKFPVWALIQMLLPHLIALNSKQGLWFIHNLFIEGMNEF